MRHAMPIYTAVVNQWQKASPILPIPIRKNWMSAACRPCWRWLMPKIVVPVLKPKLEVVPVFLPYGKQEVGEADINAVVEALVSGWLTTGPRVGEFEEAFARHCGAKEAVR